MDAPLLHGYDYSAGSPGLDINTLKSPAHGPIMTINSYYELTLKYKASIRKEANFYRNVAEFRIHLEEFKRDIFKTIEDNEFALETPKHSSTLSDPSNDHKLKAGKMISTLLQKMTRLIILDIMPVPFLSEFKYECPQVKTLKVSAGYFDEFAYIWNSCKAIKHVTLDGIIPRLMTGDKFPGEKEHDWHSLENRFLDFLNITYKSAFMESQFELLLRASLNLLKFNYEHFSFFLPRDKTKIKYLSPYVISEKQVINHLQNARTLQSLSFYRDENDQVINGNLTDLNINTKENLLELSTTIRLCPLKDLCQYENLQHLIIWWTENIHAMPVGGASPILDLQNNLPGRLKSLRLYFSGLTLYGEALHTGLLGRDRAKLYVEKVSKTLAELIAHAIKRNFEVEICIVKLAIPQRYYSPILLNPSNKIASIGMTDNYETILEKVLPITKSQND